MKVTEPQLLLSWGLTTFLAWTITGVGYLIPLLPSKVLVIWAGLMAVPILITLSNYRSNISNKVFNLWAVLVAVLMAQNFLFNSFPVFSYFTLWLLAGAAGYYYTSGKLPPPSEKTYLYGAAINLLAAPLAYFMPLSYLAFLAAVVQAGPIFHDYWKVHR